MADSSRKPVDSYIAASAPKARGVLRKLRSTIRKAAPDAHEVMSYGIPAYKQHKTLIFFAGFKNHVGIFPPVRGDARLDKALARFRGPKGNLRFPLDEPMPYELIERIVKLRVKQDGAAAAKGKAKRHR